MKKNNSKKPTSKKALKATSKAVNISLGPAALGPLTPAQFKKLKRLSKTFGVNQSGVFSGFWPVPGADAATFKALDGCYGHDKDHIFYNRDMLKGEPTPDPASFALLGSDLAKDKNHLYWRQHLVLGLKSKSVHYINDHYLSDGKKIYYFAQNQNHIVFGPDGTTELGIKPTFLPDANPKKFQALGDYYSADDQNVYYRDLKLKNVDAKTFQYISGSFAKDAKAVYFAGNVIKGAKPESFDPKKAYKHFGIRDNI